VVPEASDMLYIQIFIQTIASQDFQAIQVVFSVLKFSKEKNSLVVFHWMLQGKKWFTARNFR
jgi:hypothetical protein